MSLAMFRLELGTHLTLLSQPQESSAFFSTSKSLTNTLLKSNIDDHDQYAGTAAPNPTQDVRFQRQRTRHAAAAGNVNSEKSANTSCSGITKLSYVILDDHIAESDALLLLGRLVANIQRPLENYTPQLVRTHGQGCDRGLIHPGPKSQSSFSSSTGTFNSRASTIIEPTRTAQTLFPNADPSLFVLPDLPLSLSESTSATLSHTSSYSSQTQSLLKALLGLSLSSSNTTSRTFNLTAKVIRTLSVTQHAQVFADLMKIHGREVKKRVKASRGTMYFVIGVKIATDATVETREERGKILSGNIEFDSASGLGTTSGVGELMTAAGGYSRQRGWENIRKEQVDGDRAFAMEYCLVKLHRKVEFVKRNEERKKLEEMAAEAKKELEKDFPVLETDKIPIGETTTNEGKMLYIYKRDLDKLTMEKGDAVWTKMMRYKWLREIVDRAKTPRDGYLQSKDEATLEIELEQEQMAIKAWHARKRKLIDTEEKDEPPTFTPASKAIHIPYTLAEPTQGVQGLVNMESDNKRSPRPPPSRTRDRIIYGNRKRGHKSLQRRRHSYAWDPDEDDDKNNDGDKNRNGDKHNDGNEASSANNINGGAREAVKGAPAAGAFANVESGNKPEEPERTSYQYMSRFHSSYPSSIYSAQSSPSTPTSPSTCSWDSAESITMRRVTEVNSCPPLPTSRTSTNTTSPRATRPYMCTPTPRCEIEPQGRRRPLSWGGGGGHGHSEDDDKNNDDKNSNGDKNNDGGEALSANNINAGEAVKDEDGRTFANVESRNEAEEPEPQPPTMREYSDSSFLRPPPLYAQAPAAQAPAGTPMPHDPPPRSVYAYDYCYSSYYIPRYDDPPPLSAYHNSYYGPPPPSASHNSYYDPPPPSASHNSYYDPPPLSAYHSSYYIPPDDDARGDDKNNDGDKDINGDKNHNGGEAFSINNINAGEAVKEEPETLRYSSPTFQYSGSSFRRDAPPPSWRHLLSSDNNAYYQNFSGHIFTQPQMWPLSSEDDAHGDSQDDDKYNDGDKNSNGDKHNNGGETLSEAVKDEEEEPEPQPPTLIQYSRSSSKYAPTRTYNYYHSHYSAQYPSLSAEQGYCSLSSSLDVAYARAPVDYAPMCPLSLDDDAHGDSQDDDKALSANNINAGAPYLDDQDDDTSNCIYIDPRALDLCPPRSPSPPTLPHVDEDEDEDEDEFEIELGRDVFTEVYNGRIDGAVGFMG